MVEDLVDPRRDEPPYVLDERPMLEAWLEFHRTTLLLKCEGSMTRCVRVLGYPPRCSRYTDCCGTWPKWSAAGSGERCWLRMRVDLDRIPIEDESDPRCLSTMRIGSPMSPPWQAECAVSRVLLPPRTCSMTLVCAVVNRVRCDGSTCT